MFTNIRMKDVDSARINISPSNILQKLKAAFGCCTMSINGLINGCDFKSDLFLLNGHQLSFSIGNPWKE